MITRCRYSVQGQGAAGYSLAEVLVVLAIMGLIIAVVPSGLTRVLPGARLTSAAEMLAAELRAGRARAIETGTEIRWRVNGNKLAAIDGRKMDELGGVKQIEYWGFDPSGRLTRQETFRFLPDGSSTGGHFILRAEGRERRVAVHWLFGHVEVQRGEGAS